jgi:hypothetical protein
MAAKRKRASSTASTPATSASLENGSRPDATSASKGKSRDVESGADHEHKGPRVNYIAAEGSSSWTKSLGKLSHIHISIFGCVVKLTP